MIQVRCKACKRLAFEASEDATGTIRIRCKRSTCGRFFTVTLPAPECSARRYGHGEESARTGNDARVPTDSLELAPRTNYRLAR